MASLLPSSRLLPVTVIGLATVLSLKAYAVIATAPSAAAMRNGAGQVLVAAGTTASAGVIPQAHATSAQPADEGGKRSEAAPPPAAPAVPPATPASLAPLPPPPPLVPVPLSSTTAALPPDASPFRRSQMEERERQVTQREAATAAAEKRIADRVTELMALQERLQALEGGLKQRDEANWAGLVKLYEGMKPHDAAAIFNALDKPVLLDILDRMKPAKASPVLAAMEAERARQVTAELAARRTRSTTGTD